MVWVRREQSSKVAKQGVSVSLFDLICLEKTRDLWLNGGSQ
jgi:hypothetical protein